MESIRNKFINPVLQEAKNWLVAQQNITDTNNY